MVELDEQFLDDFRRECLHSALESGMVVDNVREAEDIYTSASIGRCVSGALVDDALLVLFEVDLAVEHVKRFPNGH
jgi:hypothetical protein